MLDLHIHTTSSDGKYSPEKILSFAEENKGEIISITDHNSFSAYKEVIENRSLFSGKVLPGAELSGVYKGILMEVLAYGFDIDEFSEAFKNKFHPENFDKNQIAATKRMLEEKRIVFDLKRLDYITERWGIKYAVYDSFLQNPVNAEVLTNKDNMKSFGRFFRNEMYEPTGGIYVDSSEFRPDAFELCKFVGDCGALCFLAHPYISYPLHDDYVESSIKELPIHGVECKHASFSKEKQDTLISLSKKYGKYISGGSDFHSDDGENKLFTGINNSICLTLSDVSEWIDKVRTI